MKRFILSVLCVAVFFVGLGSLLERAGARFRSDEKALELVRKARVAIGGDAAISSIRSLQIVGKTSKVLDMNGTAQKETGETEIAMQLPNKFVKMTRFGHSDGSPSSEAQMKKEIDVVVVGDGGAKPAIEVPAASSENGKTAHKIFIKKSDGTTQEVSGPDAAKFRVHKIEGDKTVFMTENKTAAGDPGNEVRIMRVDGARGIAAHGGGRQNEMLRLTLGLLMSAPEGVDVDYQLGGEGVVDGTSCNIVVANAGGSSFKIYLSKSSDLPVMLSYTGVKMTLMSKRHSGAQNGEEAEKIIIDLPEGARPLDKVEFNVKFDDYRGVGGIQLPYKWTQSAAGNANETFDVTSYEVNPANIADKFKNEKVMIRTKKPIDQ